MRSSRLLILASVGFMVGACSTQPPWVAEAETPATTPKQPVHSTRPPTVSAPRVATTQEHSYRLDAGDRVRVIVSGQDSLSNAYDVDTTGSIAIPTVGAVPARGLNTVQLSSAIARRLKQANVRDPQVAVQVETYRPFSIRGDVTNPGQYPYVNNMTTETAIAIAGGLKSHADKKSVTISNGDPDAEPSASPPDSAVHPGDTVTVTEEQ